SGVTFMDSSGINALVTTHQTATRTQGWLRLAGPREAASGSCTSSASTTSSPATPPSNKP
ncbi:STAS domain-containing protein, partial [Streptomyces sp. SD11]|uniref:STAS domain-containing protein n=1 Tax=Streptomyces sp. SD11 TaxID=3452209 RepID=UPI003F8C1938